MGVPIGFDAGRIIYAGQQQRWIAAALAVRATPAAAIPSRKANRIKLGAQEPAGAASAMRNIALANLLEWPDACDQTEEGVR